MSRELLPLLVLPALVGCTAEIPQFDDDPRPEVCGGAVCFAPDHVAVRRWGDGEVTMAAWRIDPAANQAACELPRSGKRSIPGQAVVIELHHARAGARLPVLSHQQSDQTTEPHATIRSVRIEPGTGRALADEEGVTGEITVLDLDPAEGRFRVRVRARWSSGVSGEQLFDVLGWPGCAA